MTARDVFGARRLASVVGHGVNQAAQASVSPRQGYGVSGLYTLGWSDGCPVELGHQEIAVIAAAEPVASVASES